jgi:phage terminase large subunit-like protein
MANGPVTFAEDVDPELVAEWQQVEEDWRKAAPLRFARTWRCTVPDCDGQPHEGMPGKHARGSQVIPDEGRVWYLAGGRGSGKTWAGARNFGQMVLETEPGEGDDHTEWGVIAPTYRDARDVAVEGPSGLLRALGGYFRQGGLVLAWNRTFGHLRLTNGALIYVDSAEDGAVRVQGKNLYGAWCTEVGLWRSWRRAWHESVAFAVRRGRGRIFCDGTPKRASLAKELLDDERVGKRRLRMVDNLANLAKEVVDELVARYQGTRLGEQELEGVLVTDVEGALWRMAQTIDPDRVHPHRDLLTDATYWEDSRGRRFAPPRWWRTVRVALDPSDGLQEGDEQGWAVVAQSPETYELYVLESGGERLDPWDWLVMMVEVAAKYLDQTTGRAVELIVEKNHGGRYLTRMLDDVQKHLGKRVPVRVIDATKETGGKFTRAEQVAGLYERHKVHHVGTHAVLEDQQCTWTGKPDPESGKQQPSPDRMDALVWALWDFRRYRLEAPPQDAEGVYPMSNMPQDPGPDWQKGDDFPAVPRIKEPHPRGVYAMAGSEGDDERDVPTLPSIRL